MLFITKISTQACLLGKKVSSDVVSKIINILLNEPFQNLGQLNTKKRLKSEIQNKWPLLAAPSKHFFYPSLFFYTMKGITLDGCNSI